MLGIYFSIGLKINYFALDTIEDCGAFLAGLAARFSFNDSCGCFLASLELLRSLLMLHSQNVRVYGYEII